MSVVTALGALCGTCGRAYGTHGARDEGCLPEPRRWVSRGTAGAAGPPVVPVSALRALMLGWRVEADALDPTDYATAQRDCAWELAALCDAAEGKPL